MLASVLSVRGPCCFGSGQGPLARQRAARRGARWVWEGARPRDGVTLNRWMDMANNLARGAAYNWHSLQLGAWGGNIFVSYRDKRTVSCERQPNARIRLRGITFKLNLKMAVGPKCEGQR